MDGAYEQQRNLFYIGAYSQVTNASLKARVAVAQGEYAKTVTIAQQSNLVGDEACAIVASFLSESESGETVEERMMALVARVPDNEDVLAMAGTLLILLGNLKGAIALLSAAPRSLECVALLFYIYLSLNRNDLASTLLDQCKAWADDATLFQLLDAWNGLQTPTSSKSYEVALYTFLELCSSSVSQPPAKMTVSQIVYSLCVLKFAEAEALVEECLGRHRQGGSVVNPPELVDAVACKVVLDVRQRGLSLDVLMAPLTKLAPTHPLVLDLQAKDQEFDRIAARFLV